MTSKLKDNSTNLQSGPRVLESMQDAKTSSSASFAYTSGQIAIVRISMSGSYAIPLEVVSPHDAKLLLWTFIGFCTKDSAIPTCLLAVEFPSSGFLEDVSLLSVRSNAGDRHLCLSRDLSPLSRNEIHILSRALIETIEPSNVHSLSELLPVLAPELDDICAAACNCELTRLNDVRTVVATGLDFVPTCIITRTSIGYVCTPLESVRVRVGERTDMTLLLTASLNNRHFSTAIFSGNGQHAAARIMTAV